MPPRYLPRFKSKTCGASRKRIVSSRLWSLYMAMHPISIWRLTTRRCSRTAKRGLAEDALSGVEGTKCIRCEWLRYSTTGCKKMKNSTAVEQDTAKTLEGYILVDLKMSSLISLKHRIVITQSTSPQHIAVNEQILPSVYMYEEI